MCTLDRTASPRGVTPVASWRAATLVALVALVVPLHAQMGAQTNTGAPSCAPLESDPAFVPNLGQWPDDVRFVARQDTAQVVVRDGGWDLLLPEQGASDAAASRRRGVLVRFTWTGLPLAPPSGSVPLDGARHYLVGDDPDAWVIDVPSYRGVRFAAADGTGGIDVVLGAQGLQLASDLDPAVLAGEVGLLVEGGDAIVYGDDGGALVTTALGALQLAAPMLGLATGSGLLAVGGSGALRPLGAATVGFDVPGGTIASEVEVGLQWATFLGGQSFDYAMTVAIDGEDRTVLGGFTEPSIFPTTPGAFDVTLNGARDAFVTCLEPDGGTLAWSTYLGGGGIEEVRALALDALGRVTVTGYTASPNFPVTAGAYDTAFDGGGQLLGSDVFVTRLLADGSGLVFSTFLGGTADDIGLALALGGEDEVVVAGTTRSLGYPVTPGAFDVGYNGGSPDLGDGFVSCLVAGGTQLGWSTFLGGADADLVNALVVHGWGAVTAAGWTASTNFPTTDGAWDRELSGGSDAFVVRLTPGGDALGWATLLGGSSDENATALAPYGVTGIVVAGTTRSNNFPVSADAYATSYAGGSFYGDTFVTAIAFDGASLLASSYLGGGADDFPVGIERDADGTLVVGGWTQSADFPATLDADDDLLGGGNDGFLVRLSTDLGALLYGTFVGGSETDKILDVAVGTSGRAAVVGWTTSGDFPTTQGAYDPSFSGLQGLINDAFVAQLVPGALAVPATAPWKDIGFPVAGGSPGVPVLGGEGTLLPGSLGAIVLDGALPGAAGVLLIGAGGVPVAYKQNPVIMPWPLLQVVPFLVDAQGGLLLPFVVDPTAPSGTMSVMQAWVIDPSSTIDLKASNSLLAVVP